MCTPATCLTAFTLTSSVYRLPLITPPFSQIIGIRSVCEARCDSMSNHLMAGKSLRVGMEMLSVRAATAEEISHGHVHGEYGHLHH